MNIAIDCINTVIHTAIYPSSIKYYRSGVECLRTPRLRSAGDSRWEARVVRLIYTKKNRKR